MPVGDSSDFFQCDPKLFVFPKEKGMEDNVNDGSHLPIGTFSDDGELQVRKLPDGSVGWSETELGQHQRWMRSAPELFALYMDNIEKLIARNNEYHELILAVARKFPNETRHQTALRYIRQAEECSGPAKSDAAVDPHV